MASPQRPVRVLPQTRRRGPAINNFEPNLYRIVNLLSYNVQSIFGDIKISDLTLISKNSLINFREYTCCPDVFIGALLSASKTLPAIAVLRFLQTFHFIRSRILFAVQFIYSPTLFQVAKSRTLVLRLS